jgi:hypothetical protein
LASPRLLLALGIALLAVAGVAYLVGYRGSSRPQTVSTAPTTAPTPPAVFGFARAWAERVSSYAASVAWTTTDASTAQLQWGPEGVEPVLWDAAATSSARHLIRLTGLAASTSYRVTIVASAAGEQDVRTAFSFTTAAAPSQVQGTVRDGVLLVNGEPFFPLLSWEQCPVQWQPSLDAGIDLFAVGSPCASPDSAATTLAGRALVAGTSDAALVAGPSLLGSFSPDEADARGLTGSSLPALPEGIRFLTLTAHFASMAAPQPSGRGMYPGLVAAADIIGFDFYPLQELCRRDLLPADFDAQQELQALAPGKPTFQWIEARGLRCGTSPDVSITPATIRTESWLSIAAGAHGLAFFPPDWNNGAVSVIRGISDRIHQLEPALLQPAQTVQVEGASGVRASARTYHDAIYVIAVNAGTTASDVRLTVPSLGDRTLRTLGEPRTLGAHRDAFTDRIAPLRVRIYVAAPPRSGDAPGP